MNISRSLVSSIIKGVVRNNTRQPFLACTTCLRQTPVRHLRMLPTVQQSPWKQAYYSNAVNLVTPSSLVSCKLSRTLLPAVQICRTITVVSRLGKRKSCKSALKRFRRVKGGYLKRWRSGMVRKQRKKSSWRKFRLRGSVLVRNRAQLKTLNKMMYKH